MLCNECCKSSIPHREEGSISLQGGGGVAFRKLALEDELHNSGEFERKHFPLVI